MSDTTLVSLLEKLSRPQEEPQWQQAWERFANLYTPLLYLWLQYAGVKGAEADDLVQEVFATLVTEMKKFRYDRDKSFRSWLRTVAINKYRKMRRRSDLLVGPMPEEPPADPRAQDPAEEFWKKDFQHHLLRRALQVIRADFSEEACTGFWQFHMEGESVAAIAAHQGKTEQAVIAANYRILTRLRQELRGMWD